MAEIKIEEFVIEQFMHTEYCCTKLCKQSPKRSWGINNCTANIKVMT